jgi:hypothetical protein
MSAIVQATCPGCKRVLRIPAEWMRQPIRCKHCGKILNAKEQPAAGPAKPAVPPRPEAAKQPQAKPDAPRIERAAGLANGRPSAGPPEADTALPRADSPFDDLTHQEVRSRRRRKNPNTGMVLIVALLVLLLLSGASVAVFLKFGSALTSPVAEKRDEGNAGKDSGKTEVTDERRADDHRQAEADVWDKSVPFPRRALLISVHNYLFANPVGVGLPTAGARKISGLPDKLYTGLRIPRNQIAHLSDVAPGRQARPPVRPIIEETLTAFLGSCRAQDRVFVFFIGHAVESGDEAYLVPLEGELDRPETLIPLKQVYEKLKACAARQKVLVMDVCRLNPVIGAERPGGEAMGKTLAAALASPPPGVQVWSACGPEQQSYETEKDVMGVFLDKLQTTLERASEGKLRLQEHIQKPDDLLPLAGLKEAVDVQIEKELKPLKLAQTTRLTGMPPEAGASFDAAEPPPPVPTLAAAPPPLAAEKQAELMELVADIAVPPIKPSVHDAAIDFSILPPFDGKRLEAYFVAPGGETDLRKTVRKTQILLYAVSGSQAPHRLKKAVEDATHTLKGNLTILREGYRARKTDDELKKQILRDERAVAPILGRLTEAHEDLLGVADKRDAEPKRWQANYDFMLARLEAQIAYVWEYQSMLGQMRRETPALDRELHGGWKLAATTTLSGDSTGKKMASSSRKILDKIIKQDAGTPWEILAKRDKLTALGLEWKPAQ